MRSLLRVVAVSFLFVSSAALAVDSGMYMGVGVASGSMTACVVSNCNNFDEKAQESGHGRVIVGYDFNRFIGAEFGFADYGSYKVKNSTMTTVGTVKINGVSLAARGGYKFGFGLSVFAKLGLASMNTKYTADPGWTMTGQTDRNSTGALFGVGVQYDFNDDFAVRMISEAASFDDGAYQGAVGGLNLIGILRF